MKPTNTARSDAHINLKRLYDERVKELTQGEFGKKFGIGTQGMVWQYLSGRRPLNVEAAAKFARGLSCTIFDISPEMAEELRQDVVPVLAPRSWWKKTLAKAATLLIAASAPACLVAPHGAEAANETPVVYYVKRFWRKLWPQRSPAV